MPFLGKEPEFIQHGVGVIEPSAAFAYCKTHVPLSRMIGTVAQWLEVFGNELSEIGNIPGCHQVTSGLLGVVAGKQTTPRRPAACRGIALREAQAFFSQLVQMRCVNVATIASGIRKTHIINQENHEVWLFRGSRSQRCSSERPARSPQKVSSIEVGRHFKIITQERMMMTHGF